MKKSKNLALLFIIFTLASVLARVAQAQTPTENMKTFLDTEFPGIKVQVNATAETQPGEYVNVTLSLTTQADVYVKYLNLSIFGFINGTDKIMMTNITDNEFPLNSGSKEYNCTFGVPEQVWGVCYGEIVSTYNATWGPATLTYDKLTSGFTLTNVENVYLKNVEEQLESLTSAYEQLNQTYWELQRNYTSLKGNLGELEGTRQAVIVLAITSVFFVVTTVYLITRKPKQYF
jgi:hypothetical protein